MIVLKEKLFFTQQNVYTSINDTPTTKMHKHEYIEIFYVIEGTAEHLINSQKHILSAGDLYILRPDDIHQFKGLNSSPLLHRNFFIKRLEFQRLCDFINPNLFDSLINHPTFLKTKLAIQFINCFELQLKLLQGTDILYAILIEILSLFITHTENNELNYPLWLQSFLSFLDKPETFSKTTGELLQTTNRTHSYVSTAFKKYVGITISEYRTDAKLQYAYSLLLSSGLSIQQISQECGFESRTYFYKKFKKKFGIIPGDLRKT